MLELRCVSHSAVFFFSDIVKAEVYVFLNISALCSVKRELNASAKNTGPCSSPQTRQADLGQKACPVDQFS